MTAQIGNSYFYNGKRYTNTNIGGDIFFEPRNYGLKPCSRCTACWSGYWYNIQITEDKIYLKDLFIGLSNKDEIKELNGILPSKNYSGEYIKSMGHYVYKDLNMPIQYTGTILLGNNFDDNYYVHMGYQCWYGYSDVKEFTFDNGKLVDVVDKSEDAKRERENTKTIPFVEYLGKIVEEIEIENQNKLEI